MNELDYGAPDQAATEGTDASMHAPGGALAEGDAAVQDTEMDEQSGAGRRKGPKAYYLPAGQAVEASSTRDVRPQPFIDPEEELLVPPSRDEDLTPMPQQPDESVLDNVPLSQVRLAVLNLSGQPITQLSTSRIFAFLTACGAAPLAIEWIDDQSCNVVFKDFRASRTALEYLMIPRRRKPVKKEEDDGAGPFAFGGSAAVEVEDGAVLAEAEMARDDVEITGTTDTLALPDLDDMEKVATQETTFDEQADVELGIALLTCRKTRPVPLKLFTPAERDAATRLVEMRAEQAREAQKKKIKQEGGDPEPEENDRPEIYRELEREERMNRYNDRAVYNVRRLTSSLYVRFCIKDIDIKGTRSYKQSEWYRDHGKNAGRQVVERLLVVGDLQEPRELLASGEGSGRNGGAHMDSLSDRGSRRGRRGRGGRQDREAMAALEEDMDDFQRSRDYDDGRREGRDRERSASPMRDLFRMSAAAGGIRIKGRGSMRAPRANVWGDEDEYTYEAVDSSSIGGKMVSDEIERRRQRTQDESRARWEEDRPRIKQEPGLEDRLGAHPDTRLQDRLGKSALLSDRIR